MPTDALDLVRTRQAYDAVAKDYARLLPDLSLETPLDRAVLAAFAEMLREQGDPLVVDVGCGAGRVTKYLHDAGLHVIGLDLSPEMVGIARATYENLSFAAGQAGALALCTGTVGGLVAWYSLINMPTGALVEVFAEFARVTRPGATVLVAFQAGNGQRVDRATSYEQPVSLSYYRHAVQDVSEAPGRGRVRPVCQPPTSLRSVVQEHATSRSPGVASLAGDRCRSGFGYRNGSAAGAGSGRAVGLGLPALARGPRGRAYAGEGLTNGDGMSEQDSVSQWCAAGEQGDAGRAARCLAQDVELISPLTEQFRFVGREQVRELLTAAFTAINGIKFHTRLGDGETQAVFYRAHLGQQVLEEAQLLRLDSAGLIREITLFARPLPALTGLMATLGPALARQQHRPALARFLAASTAPLHALTRLGEHHVVPLAAPTATAPDPT